MWSAKERDGGDPVPPENAVVPPGPEPGPEPGSEPEPDSGPGRAADGEGWPTARGSAGPDDRAQVFRADDPGREPLDGEAEPAAPSPVDDGTTTSGPAVLQPAAFDPLRWDDGLIARRAPAGRTPAPAPARPGVEQVPAEAEDLEQVAAEAEDVEQVAVEAEDVEQEAVETEEDRPDAAEADPDDVGADVPGMVGVSAAAVPEGPAPAPPAPRSPLPTTLSPTPPPLLRRLRALGEVIGLSRTRLDDELLAEAGRVLDEAGARGRLSSAYTTVAIAGATGSGKSSLFNSLAGRALSEVSTRRPTTAEPVGCTWEAEREGGADGLLDRLGIAPHARRRVKDAALHGLVLVDLPDHDSVARGHREHVDRLLRLVDAVVWVVDPEKYADALLHERYLRPLAGYAEVTFVVLNQVDRLPGEEADVVLDDLRRLLDEDGMALGEHGEPGARVLSCSTLTGAGIGELRSELAEFTGRREAARRRLTADLDGVVEQLRPLYADPALRGPTALTEEARERFEDQLATAVGATAAGQAAERAWQRHAERACGTPWSQFVRWNDERRQNSRREDDGPGTGTGTGTGTATGRDADTGPDTPLPAPRADDGGPGGADDAGGYVARPVLDEAVRELTRGAVSGLPPVWRRTVREAAGRGARELPEALEEVVGAARRRDHRSEGAGRPSPAQMPRPAWWSVATVVQGLLLAVQALGVFWLVSAAFGYYDGAPWTPVLLLTGGAVCAPLLAWGCRVAARGPARAYGLDEERRLRWLAARCGRSRVLEPVAAELLRYREVREQFVIAAGEVAGEPVPSVAHRSVPGSDAPADGGNSPAGVTELSTTGR